MLEEINGRNVEESLPMLDEVDYETAVSHGCLSWAHGFMQNWAVGQTHWLGNVGLHLQKVDEKVVRCIAVVDHPFSFAALAMQKVTFKMANMKMEIDPYTIVIPYVESEGDSKDIPGLEVI